MNIVSTLLHVFVASLFGVFLLTSAFHLNAYAKPEVSISPSCGPKSGFGVSVKAKGFEPDSIVSWKLADSEGMHR